MNSPLQNKFRIQIQSLYKFDFQDFITKLFMFRYGATNYIPPRDIKDKGADGIITDKETIIACYGPEKIDEKRYLKKISDDFKSYSDNWQTNYKNWTFVTNNDIPEWAIRKINSLQKSSSPVGLKNILQMIDELPSFQKRELGSYLNIEKELFAKDYLNEILEDLIKETSFVDENIQYQQQVYFPKKIELNYDKEDVDSILQEYDIYFEDGIFSEIESLLFGYEDEETNKLKIRIITDYNSKAGDFKSRLQQLLEKYLDKYSSENDDEYLFYIRAILIYLFEQCLIGRKTKGEL